jgi:uncharacterized protein YprB with RNaseH-like and TPR domain
MKAYLDIETDRSGKVCVIGVFLQGHGFIQMYGTDITAENLEEILSQATTLVTFNGDLFDLPVLEKSFNLDLKSRHLSIDLHKVKKKLGIKGGLKELEKMYGIPRNTWGINGYKAILLWEKYQRTGRSEALALLLEYNREDVINLIALEKVFLDHIEERRMEDDNDSAIVRDQLPV